MAMCIAMSAEYRLLAALCVCCICAVNPPLFPLPPPPSSAEATLVPFVAKVRCSRRDVTFGDFIEVDVPVRTFPTLMYTLCQELNMSRKSVARVRKLPDVWVRKDSDVRRMSDYVELEVVLKDDTLDQHHFQHRKL